MSDLRPCPCCNKQVKIRICDDEGNIRPDSYRNDPWSGLKFWIEHVYEEGYNCPLAHHSDELHGLIYESKEEAIEVWNTRPIEDALRAELETVKVENTELWIENQRLIGELDNAESKIKTQEAELESAKRRIAELEEKAKALLMRLNDGYRIPGLTDFVEKEYEALFAVVKK